MSDVINIKAASDRNIIEDGATPALTLENTSSGNCLRLQNAGGTGQALSIVSCPTTAINIGSGGMAVTGDYSITGDLTVTGDSIFKSTASASNVVDVSHTTAIGSPTVAPLKVTHSAASGVAFEMNIGLNSSASISVMAGTIPVRLTGEDKVVYIPLFEIS